MQKKNPLHKKYFILSFLKNKIREEDIYKVGPILKWHTLLYSTRQVLRLNSSPHGESLNKLFDV